MEQIRLELHCQRTCIEPGYAVLIFDQVAFLFERRKSDSKHCEQNLV